MASLITERRNVQEPFIKHAEQVGWQYISEEEALALRGGEQGKFFYDILEQNILRLNEFLRGDNTRAQEIIRQLENIPDTINGNKQVLEWVLGNITQHDAQERRGISIILIDFQDPENNQFHITEEWTHAGISKRNRSDIMFLVNGIPLAIIENKNPKKQKAMEEAITQLKRYQGETPEMLCCPQVFNITDVVEYFYGATWNYSKKNIFNWKKELKQKREKQISLKEAVTTFFDKTRFLKLIKYWVLFINKDDELRKTVLRQHQIRAVNKIEKRCEEKDKPRGLIWHTQGSGKTFTMITAANVILEKNPNATVMMIIDRQELEGQLSGWVDSLIGEGQLGQQKITIRKAESKRELQNLLDSDCRGLIISMIHKFDKIRNNSCARKDFYVLIDEAHRSVNKDLGSYLMAALPNATLFGFTGTPIDKISKGEGTFKIFGQYDKEGYLDKYPIWESIDDETTLKLRYESVPSRLKLADDELLEEEFFNNAESEGVSDIDDLNEVLRKAVKLRTFLKADDRVKKVAEYIAEHFKKNIQQLGCKAFLVAVDREACALYKEALDKLLPPKMSQVIYSSSHNDPELLAKYKISPDKEKKVKKSFKKAGSEPHILIVTDKLLTGYDAPILYCMYLDKPMRDHVLLQAIARVNRPYEEDKSVSKHCGLVVDFVGIFKSMKKALAFDPDEVNAVIEDIDLLFDRFKNIIDKDKDLNCLPLLTEKDDQSIEKLIYENFQDIEERKKFIKKAKDLTVAYDVLSPDGRLEPYFDKYQNILEIQLLLTRAYSGDPDEAESKFLGELSKKTERLVQEKLHAHKFRVDKTYEINVETLKQIKKSSGDSNAIKIMNLLKSVLKEAKEKQDENPALISIAERANKILEEFKKEQRDTKRTLEKSQALFKEAADSKKEYDELGLESEAFLVYWLLKKAKFKNAIDLAEEIDSSFKKFENFNDNAEDRRQLKKEIYAALTPFTTIDDAVELVDDILTLIGKIYESR